MRGNLKTMELSELLQFLHRGSKTGTLVIDNGKIEKRIYFKKGAIVSSAGTNPKEYLGQFLVSHGYIDEITLAKAIEMQQENNMLLGKILITIGAMAESDLDRMLRLKAEESIFDLFTWEEGDFEFEENELPEYNMMPLELDNITGLILEGHTRIDEWGRINQTIHSMQDVVVTVGQPNAPSADDRAQQILELINDDRTIEEIAREFRTSEFEVCRALIGEVEKGRLKVIRPRIDDTANQEESDTEESIDPQILIQAASKHAEAGNLQLALRHAKAARILDPIDIPIRRALEETEEKIKQQLLADGINMMAVPQLDCKLEDINSSELSQEAGFMLTRVDGTYNLQALVKISPLPLLEAQIVIWELKQAGLITLGKVAAGKSRF